MVNLRKENFLRLIKLENHPLEALTHENSFGKKVFSFNDVSV